MKKTLPMIAVLAAFSSVAYAQSSVTLYGLIDEGLAYNSNSKGASQYSASAGNLQGDRWGMKGTEDLGGGLQALFTLESGYNVNNGTLGQGGALFGRKAFVGLSSDHFGTITLGRQYDVLGDYVGGFESANAQEQVPVNEWASIYNAHAGDMDNLDNSARINNTIKYASEQYDGMSFGAMYSLGGKAGNFSEDQLYGFGAHYGNGPLSLGVAYEKANDPNYSVFGTNPSASATGLNVSTPIYSGFASAGSWQVISTGAAYRIGNATIGGVYSNVAFQNLGSVAGTGLNPNNLSGTATFNLGEVNLAYNVTSRVQLGAAYTYTRGSSVGAISGARYGQAALSADYTLSKRTDLYVVGLYEHASGVDSTGNKAVAAITNLSPSTTDAQTAVILGMRHKF